MKLSENSDEIVVRYVPVWKWLAGGGLTFAFGGLCVWLIFFSAVNLFDVFSAFAYIVATVLVVFLEINLISMICAPLTTVAVNRKTKSVDISRQRFYGSKTERFYFTQIKKFKSYKSAASLSSKYFLALVLANQKTLKLKIPVSLDKQETVNFVKKLNKFVKRQAAVKENINHQSV